MNRIKTLGLIAVIALVAITGCSTPHTSEMMVNIPMPSKYPPPRSCVGCNYREGEWHCICRVLDEPRPNSYKGDRTQ